MVLVFQSVKSDLMNFYSVAKHTCIKTDGICGDCLFGCFFTQDEEFYRFHHMQRIQIIEKKWFELVFCFFSCLRLWTLFAYFCDFVFFLSIQCFRLFFIFFFVCFKFDFCISFVFFLICMEKKKNFGLQYRRHNTSKNKSSRTMVQQQFKTIVNV